MIKSIKVSKTKFHFPLRHKKFDSVSTNYDYDVEYYKKPRHARVFLSEFSF